MIWMHRGVRHIPILIVLGLRYLSSGDDKYAIELGSDSSPANKQDLSPWVCRRHTRPSSGAFIAIMLVSIAERYTEEAAQSAACFC